MSTPDTPEPDTPEPDTPEPDTPEPDTPSRTRRLYYWIKNAFTKIRHWIERHPFITLVASLIIGLTFGSWSTCGPRCGFDADLFGAWGAWVGGLATTGAFLFTAHELVSSRRREEKMDRLRAEEVLTKARQILCRLQWHENAIDAFLWEHEGNVPDHSLRWTAEALYPPEEEKEEPSLLLRMDNYSSSPITNIRVLAGHAKKEMGRRDQLDPRASDSWTCKIDPTDLGLKYNPEEGHLDVDPPSPSDRVRAEFTLEGYRFQWDSNTGKVELIANPHA